MSLRVVPAASNPEPASTTSTANLLGLHDTLQYGPKSLATEIKGLHPLEHRLANWEETQQTLKLNLQRNLYGLHLPVRQLMEWKIVAATSHMPAMATSNLHLDILMGRDEALDADEIIGDIDRIPALPVHAQMEKKLKL